MGFGISQLEIVSGFSRTICSRAVLKNPARCWFCLKRKPDSVLFIPIRESFFFTSLVARDMGIRYSWIKRKESKNPSFQAKLVDPFPIPSFYSQPSRVFYRLHSPLPSSVL